MWKKYKPFIISIAIASSVGGLSALLTKDNMSVYEQINKPPLAPNSIVFPIVWTILFILMGVSSALVYQQKEKQNVSTALIVYAVQLFVNFFWSIIFFNLKMYLFSFIWLILLLLLIIWMIYEFYKINKVAAYLQIPYLLWVTFAGYLNFMIYYLN